ncbi:MAG: GTPase HflX, partial [Bdellovibrionales bacterium]|nr:GTPase HflX [Bdellovibrionales bacterium]
KIGSRRNQPQSLIDPDLAKRVIKVVAEIGRMIGVLIDREGRLTHVVVGSKNRIYLPDLGRFRLDAAKLRRLRLVVFAPDGERYVASLPREEVLPRGAYAADGSSSIPSVVSAGRHVAAPVVPYDLITDLEKLRLDAVVFVAVTEGGAGPASCVFVQPDPSTADRRLAFIRVSDVQRFDLDFESFITSIEEDIAAVSTGLHETDREPAVLVGAYVGGTDEAEASMAELRELARTAGLQVIDEVMQRRKKLDPKTVIGKGKVEELMLNCLDLGASLVVFDGELSPGQLRSITNLTELKVIDRSMLILDIFAQRAVTSEGRLQVELAQLKYSLPRLTESDTGLSRLTGGIGGRGPGETKLEIGRRRTRDRIAQLEARIQQVSQQRQVRRRRRQERGVPVVAIVGYTNAGKSTLLNALTKSTVHVESKLFATLDTASRRMRFPNEKEVIFVDTVGFIRELPKELIAAFRATLEGVVEADVLLHVVDASDRNAASQIETVEKTLDDLGYGAKPRLLVLNK